MKKNNKKHYHSFDDKFSEHFIEETDVKSIVGEAIKVIYYVHVCRCGLTKLISKIIK